MARTRPQTPPCNRLYVLLGLALLTAASVLVHGYHLGLEDQAIYLPGIEKAIDPHLFARDADLFLPQTRPTMMTPLIAACVRISHLSLETVVFLAQVASLFALLWGCWCVARRCFRSVEACWAAVALVAALLTMPVAGTSLYIADTYLAPRTPATAIILFCVADCMDRRWFRPMILILAAAALHIQMAFYGVLLCGFIWMNLRAGGGVPQLEAAGVAAESGERAGLARSGVRGALVLPFQSLFEPGSPAWLEASRTRAQHYLLRWEWYMWLGAVAPLAILCAFARLARRGGQTGAALLARSTMQFGILGFVAALVLTLPPQFERLTPYQPMRTAHLVTLIFLLLTGGFLGQYLLQRRYLRWMLLFVPLGFGMFYAQRQVLPASEHLELPGRSTQNRWLQAFAWVRGNTPQDAYFALDPEYMARPGEDQHGFRAFSRRSMMADALKDSGVAVLFPGAAPRWQRESHALDNWQHFTSADFAKLHAEFAVDWVILEKPVRLPFACPYENDRVAVCRIPATGHSPNIPD